MQETNIRNLLASATTINEIAVATRKALEGLGIGGVNVYRYSSSGYIKSMAREELQGDSRYEKAGPILPGEKSHFIRSGLDILLVDRLMFDGFNDSDREAGKIDLEADLVKYFGSTYTEKYSGHISQLKDALRYNLYVKYPGDGKNDLIIMANTHVKNCQRVINKLRPEPVFSSDFQRDVIFETLRNLQRPITDELHKAEMIFRDRMMLARARAQHDLLHLFDQAEDDRELMEMLLAALPSQFMRTPDATYVKGASIMLIDIEDPDSNRFTLFASNQERNPMVRPSTIPPASTSTVTLKVFSTGESMLVANAEENSLLAERGGADKIAGGSFMSVPIQSLGQSYGVLHVRSNIPNAFGQSDLEHLETLGSTLAIKIGITKSLTKDHLTGTLLQRKPGREKLERMFETARESSE